MVFIYENRKLETTHLNYFWWVVSQSAILVGCGFNDKRNSKIAQVYVRMLAATSVEATKIGTMATLVVGL